MRKGKFDFREFKEFSKKVEKLSNKQVDEFISACAKELAARLLREVTKRTPVGNYDGNDYNCNVRKGNKNRIHKGNKVTGKNGSTLRKGWTAGKSVSDYVDSLDVNHTGKEFVIEVTNPVKYASYVEYGHRTRNHKGWVKGHFMLAISEQEIESASPAILERKIRKMLGECFK